MTYNISVTPGSGETVAADQVIDPDLGTVKEQVIKIADGTLGGTGRMTITSGNAHVDVQTSVLPTGASTSANQSTELTRIGDVTETAPATDTASSGLNGRLQRIAQRITSLIALIPSALTGSGNFKVAVVETTVTQPVSGTVTANAGANLNTSLLALESGGNLAGAKTDLDSIVTNTSDTVTNTSSIITDIGAVNETAPATDTASSGLNGRLQRIAQRLTSLIALIPSALTGSGNFKVAVVESTATQTISGTVTANAGTNLNTSLLALESGGNLAASKTDLDNISGAVTSSKMAIKSADGDNVTFGTEANTAITDSTTTNTHMSFLKGLVKIFNDVWVSGSHWLQVSIMNSTLAVTQSGNWSQRLQDGSGTAITSNSTSGSGTVGIDVNIRSIINGVPSASGKLDIKSADGDQATIGVTTGAAVVTDTTGTLQGYIRGLNKALVASVWDSTNAWLNVRRVKKDTFSTSAFTITLASLANGSGRQSTLITNTSPGTESALITVKFTTGTSPTANTTINVYLLRGDGTIADDNAGASDAAITIINAPLLGVIICNAVTSNVAYYGVFDTKSLGSLGPNFGIAVVNNTGVTANATGGNFTAQYTLMS